MVQWFSNPRLAHAHLDYPTLVPSLHAATYDSIGHVDEFVTKFWPTWMLLFLIAALTSLNRAGKSWFHSLPLCASGYIAVAGYPKLRPDGRRHPADGLFHRSGLCAMRPLADGKDRARLGLGLTLLFGAAMAKFEGFIYLALVGSWILLLPLARPSFKPSPRLWPVLAFWYAGGFALPLPAHPDTFFALRIGLGRLCPAISRQHVGELARLFLILLARMFVKCRLCQLERGGWTASLDRQMGWSFIVV